MSLYPQPNRYTCGPLALQHALVVLGRFVAEKQIIRLARSDWWSGTDEIRLGRAARAHGCRMPTIRRRTPELARKALSRYLDRRIPTLLCVDDWSHWLTAVSRRGDNYIIIDPKKHPVVHVLPWAKLRHRWGYRVKAYTATIPGMLYDLHPVIPRGRAPNRARFTVEGARFLRERRNRRLAEHWDEYFDDLIEICRPRKVTRSQAISMSEFLRRHRRTLVGEVTGRHGAIREEEVARILGHLAFVAETYGLVITRSEERRALVSIAVDLALWACSLHGIGPVYGAGVPLRK